MAQVSMMVLGSPCFEKTDLAGCFLERTPLEPTWWRVLLLGDAVFDIVVLLLCEVLCSRFSFCLWGREGCRWFEVRLVQEEVVELEPLAVDYQVLVEEQHGWAVEQEEPEEDALAPYFDPEEVEDLGGGAEVLEKDGQQVGKAQSSGIGILEECPFLQWWIRRPHACQSWTTDVVPPQKDRRNGTVHCFEILKQLMLISKWYFYKKLKSKT